MRRRSGSWNMILGLLMLDGFVLVVEVLHKTMEKVVLTNRSREGFSRWQSIYVCVMKRGDEETDCRTICNIS